MPAADLAIYSAARNGLTIRMTKKVFSLAALLAMGLVPAANARPNIVFILADDMGYADLGCYGAPDAKTPHIDQLAAEGVRFPNCYAMGPECTPSRTSFLTGRYPQRAGGLECAIGTGNVGRYDDAIALAEKKRPRLAAFAGSAGAGSEKRRIHQCSFRKVASRV